MDWTPAHFDLTKEPSLLSTITINVDPEFPGNFPRVAKWYEPNLGFSEPCTEIHLLNKGPLMDR